MSQPDPTPNATAGADLMAKAIEAHEENCPICQSNYRKHCHERETVVDFAELQITLLSATAELDHLRGEFERLAPALPVLDGILRLMQSIQQSGKPHGCELLVRDGNALLKGVTLWGAYGPSNPLDRIAQLVAERDDARARLDTILLLTEADK